MILFAGLAAIGAFAPWVTVAQVFEVSGTSREGWIVIAILLFVFAALIFGERDGVPDFYWTRIVALVGGLVIAGLGIYDWTHVDAAVTDLIGQVPGGGLVSSLFGVQWADVVVKSGWGVWLTAIAGGGLAFFSVVAIAMDVAGDPGESEAAAPSR
jgi:hypothetical protein